MEYNREMPQVVPHAEAATTLKNLGRRLSNVTGFEECIAALQKGEAASIEGVPRSARFWSVSFRGFVPLKNFGDAIRVYKNEAHLAPPPYG